MSNVIGDVVYPNGTYIKDGEERTRWLKCGVLMRNDRGSLRLKIEAMPTDMSEGPWFGVFEKDSQPPAQQAQQGFRQAPVAVPAPAPAPQQQAVPLDEQDIPF